MSTLQLQQTTCIAIHCVDIAQVCVHTVESWAILPELDSQ